MHCRLPFWCGVLLLRERGDVLACFQQRDQLEASISIGSSKGRLQPRSVTLPRLPIAHATDRPFAVPVEVRPHVGAAPATGRASEPRLEFRESYNVGPTVGVQSNVMAAMAIDQHAAYTHLPHLAEGDLDRPPVGVRRRVAADRARHAAIEAQRKAESNYQSLGPRNARELLRAGVWKSRLVRVQDFGDILMRRFRLISS